MSQHFFIACLCEVSLESSENMTFQYSSNPPTNSDKHWSTQRTKYKQINVVHAVQGQEERKDLYTGETKLPFHKWMAPHRRSTSSGQDSEVHLHLKDSVLATEDHWSERGVKEAIKWEKPSLNRGGGLQHFLSHAYNVVPHSFHQQSQGSQHFRRPSESSQCDQADKGESLKVKLGQRPCQRLSGDRSDY